MADRQPTDRARDRDTVVRTLINCVAVGVLLLAGHVVAADPPKKEARVTKIIREVNILPSDAPPRSAAENDQVNENTALRTGDESRTELTFEDLTITRLGANTLFSFNRAGHSGQLGSGSILVYVPKNSGGGEFKTNAVSVGITGTTAILESTPRGDGKLIIPEGHARVRLIKHPDQFRDVHGGQMLEFKADAINLPEPTDVDLDQIMKTHPLITDFSPLPSQDLILAVINGQQAPTAGRPPPPQPQGTPFIPRTPTPPPRGPGILIPSPSPQQPTFAPSPPPPSCWCCIDGQVFQTTVADCRRRQGQCYRSKEEAVKNCRPTMLDKPCWCCINGQVFQTTVADCRRRDGQCYGSRKEATKNCRPIDKPCWCCVNGKVFQSTAADCRQRRGQCYGSREDAVKNCRPIDKTCWCCINGKVFKTTAADCGQKDGQCYGSREEATRSCRGGTPGQQRRRTDQEN